MSIPTPIPFPQSEGNSSVYQPSLEELEIEFANQFSNLQGRFVFCANEQEMVSQLLALTRQLDWKEIYCCEKELAELLSLHQFAELTCKPLKDADVSITTCEALVARTGTIVMSAAQQSGRTVSVYAPVHVCIAYTDQLVYDIRDALQFMKQKYEDQLPSMITFASGPSRTADIEKTLVVGVHGPKEVYLFLIDRQ
ncbi:MAG TPA: LUD domain-containing protein [Parasegetibacter sp.]